MTELVCDIGSSDICRRISGIHDRNIKTIESFVGVEVIPRGTTFIVKGKEDRVHSACDFFHALADYLSDKKKDFEFDDNDIRYLSQMVQSKRTIKSDDISRIKIFIPESGRSVFPKSFNQALYLSEIAKSPIVFGIGPAGTGKTYLAVAAAIKALSEGTVSRIILTRPAVEAGENLGFLPGSLIEKINPYLRPLYDALFELLSMEKVSKMIEQGIIEIAPLAYMRGRTLSNSFIILDEAQNTTIAQMKMILTRLGQKSSIVISGDPTQIDIDKPRHSGLLHAMRILRNIPEITFVEFQATDICRHPIVQKIVDAYEKGDAG